MTPHKLQRTFWIILLGVLVMHPDGLADWREVRSAEDFVRAYPEHARRLLNSLDLDRPDLAEVKEAWDRKGAEEATRALMQEESSAGKDADLPDITREGNEVVEACRALLEYYRESDQISWLRDPSAKRSEKLVRRADEILEDIYRGFGEKGKMPRRPDGHLDWSHEGPQGDRQFKLRVNRHSHLRTLLRAYLATGEECYVRRLDTDLRDWLTAADGRVIPWGTVHLEPALRLPRWARIFYGLQQDEHFRPATRLLMLAAIPAHAEHLLDNPGGGNWVSMTQYGALTCGVCWPEFERGEAWREGAISRLEENAKGTVYPDGAQKELTAHYHMVTLSRYARAFELLHRAGREFPDAFANTISRMWNYIAYALRPDATRPLNNDSDLGPNRRHVKEAASRHGRPDWLYVVSNGRQGERPDGPPSRCFPWAGQLVSRSGWDAEAHWSFFDIGPSGYGGHRHLDFGHISVTAFGRDLLVDSGRFAYQGSLARRFRRPYAMHTRGHNTILIEGQAQGTEPAVVSEPLEEGTHWKVTEDFDFARGNWTDYEGIEGRLRHRRSLLYLRGEGWIVVDRVETDRPRTIQPLWHFHPDCGVEETDGVVQTTNDQGNLSITPLGTVEWEVELIEGREEPHPQGWYSAEYGRHEPAPCAQYTGRIEETATFAWLLWPAEGAVHPPQAALGDVQEDSATVVLTGPGEEPRTFRIPVTDGEMGL
jgi:hypothetical protein